MLFAPPAWGGVPEPAAHPPSWRRAYDLYTVPLAKSASSGWPTMGKPSFKSSSARASSLKQAPVCQDLNARLNPGPRGSLESPWPPQCLFSLFSNTTLSTKIGLQPRECIQSLQRPELLRQYLGELVFP